MIKFKVIPLSTNIFQVYAPTQDYDDEEVEKLYQEGQAGIKETKSDEIICVMGDLNAKVGQEQQGSIVAKHGLGQRINRGERLRQFCQRNRLFFANTWFQEPARKMYTWKSPGDVTGIK